MGNLARVFREEQGRTVKGTTPNSTSKYLWVSPDFLRCDKYPSLGSPNRPHRHREKETVLDKKGTDKENCTRSKRKDDDEMVAEGEGRHKGSMDADTHPRCAKMGDEETREHGLSPEPNIITARLF